MPRRFNSLADSLAKAGADTLDERLEWSMFMGCHDGGIETATSKPMEGSFSAEVGEFLVLQEGLFVGLEINLTNQLGTLNWAYCELISLMD
ncbi:hypothetical protein LWI28_026162 [Acer negundo]|uniref:Uncharacterized protein n=1 Tax=Acer negundo TaxID=4023 RepID=A0AAD5NFF5_ACENE|nr:hypothetical protein LWI28_026162 [Acer negundo]